MTMPAPSESPQPQAEPRTPLHIRLPMWKLSFLLIAAPKLLLYASVAVAALFYAGRAQREMFTAEGLATVAIFAGVALGILYLWRLTPRPASDWLRQIWTSRGIRLASTAAFGYANRLVFHVHGAAHFYWGLIIGASVMIFVTDIFVTRRALSGRIGLAQNAALLDAGED